MVNILYKVDTYVSHRQTVYKLSIKEYRYSLADTFVSLHEAVPDCGMGSFGSVERVVYPLKTVTYGSVLQIAAETPSAEAFGTGAMAHRPQDG